MSGPERAAFYVLSSALGREQGEGAPLPGRLLTFRYPPPTGGDLAGQIQADSTPSASLAEGAVEPLEDPGLLGLRDARASVRHVHAAEQLIPPRPGG